MAELHRLLVLQTLEQNLENAEAEFEETKDRKQIMEEHLKSVQSEISYSQARVTAKRKEIQSETHLRALSEREIARYDADIRVLKKERTDLLDKVNSLQNHIYRANEKMDQFKVGPATLMMRRAGTELLGMHVSSSRAHCEANIIACPSMQ